MSQPVGAALLDVNVLVALFDPDHVHHDEAHDWFADTGRRAWATCPITENGFVRAAAVLAAARPSTTIARLIASLRRFTSEPGHEFWPDTPTLTDASLFDPDRVVGHRQLTDVYLLGLAVKHRGVLATFDRKIPLAAVKGARREHLAVIAPVTS